MDTPSFYNKGQPPPVCPTCQNQCPPRCQQQPLPPNPVSVSIHAQNVNFIHAGDKRLHPDVFQTEKKEKRKRPKKAETKVVIPVAFTTPDVKPKPAAATSSKTQTIQEETK